MLLGLPMNYICIKGNKHPWVIINGFYKSLVRYYMSPERTCSLEPVIMVIKSCFYCNTSVKTHCYRFADGCVCVINICQYEFDGRGVATGSVWVSSNLIVVNRTHAMQCNKCISTYDSNVLHVVPTMTSVHVSDWFNISTKTSLKLMLK